MRVWIDLANSPHVAVFEPVVKEVTARGGEVVLTARDHAQTLSLARLSWPGVIVVGGPSPAGVVAKGASVAGRAVALARLARELKPDICVSHGSYAQVLAARAIGKPALTMMDYEAQPANHVSFRLAQRVLVPESFPARALRRFGASPRRTRRYPGFKEDLYLAGFVPDPTLRSSLGIDGEVLVVMRPGPEGALYHRGINERFDAILESARAEPSVVPLVLPRNDSQRRRYSELPGVLVLSEPVNGRALVACADLVIGAGGTMNRESALLGTPTYTLFAGPLAAVDRRLVELGAMHDLRSAGAPVYERRPSPPRMIPAERSEPIIRTLFQAMAELW